MNGPRAVQRFAGGAADELRERVAQRIDTMLLKPEDRSPAAMCVVSRHWAVVQIAGLSERVARLVRRLSPPEPSMRTSLEEATLTLESMQDEFEASLRDLSAINWDELTQQLDRVNDLLRSVVEDVAGRRATPRGPG